MRPVGYLRARDASQAVAAAGDGLSVRYLGGGTNLVDLMKLGVEAPELLVDVTEAGLDAITAEPDGSCSVGAGVRNADVAAHPHVWSRYPLLSQALLAGASPQLRNMATVGGNLMQRTRCRYFQDVDAPCNKRAPGSGCPAIAGEHHNLAIFGISEHCLASHPSDMAVALAALDATVVVRSRTAERQVVFDQFYRDPGDRPELDTTIEPGELITAVRRPSPRPGRVAHRKVRERTSFAFALVSLAAVLDVQGDHTVGGVRLALGGVAHRPWRATRAEQALLGARADTTNFRAAIDRELESATPLAHNAYKVPLVRNLVVSTLEALAIDGEPGGDQ